VDLAAPETGVEEGFFAPARRNHHQVLQSGQMREFLRDLEGARQAVLEQFMCRKPGNILAVEQDRARGRRERSRDHVEHGRLAGAVRADQAGDRAAFDFERTIVDRHDASEAFRNVSDLDERIHPTRQSSLFWMR
jgi:hypothetical protein